MSLLFHETESVLMPFIIAFGCLSAEDLGAHHKIHIRIKQPFLWQPPHSTKIATLKRSDMRQMIKCQWILKTVSTREHKERDLALCSKMSLPCKLICTDWWFLFCALALWLSFWLQKVHTSTRVTKVHNLGCNGLPPGMLCSQPPCFHLWDIESCKGVWLR